MSDPLRAAMIAFLELVIFLFVAPVALAASILLGIWSIFSLTRALLHTIFGYTTHRFTRRLDHVQHDQPQRDQKPDP